MFPELALQSVDVRGYAGWSSEARDIQGDSITGCRNILFVVEAFARREVTVEPMSISQRPLLPILDTVHTRKFSWIP